MSEAVNEDYAGSTAQEDFRSFLDEQEQEWGDDGLEEGVLDGLEEEEEPYEEPAPDAPLSQARREGTDDVIMEYLERAGGANKADPHQMYKGVDITAAIQVGFIPE